MEMQFSLLGSFWPSTIIACLERALAASFGFGYAGLGDIVGETRWRWEDVHDPPHAIRGNPCNMGSQNVEFRAWEEGRVSFLWGLIRFWRKTGSSIALECMLKDMKECSVNLKIIISNTAGALYEREVPKISRRLCFELELTGEAA